MIHNYEDIQLRSIDKDDKELDAALQDYSILKYMSEKRVHPGDISREVRFKIEKNGEVVGEASIHDIRWYNRKGTLSIILAKEYHGMGIGKKASLAIMQHAFDAMNFHRLEAEAVEYNPKSKNLLEALGFRKEGIMREAKYFEGKYHSVIKFGILKREYDKLYKKI
ncbi:MAG: GNAT family N-acetyltransferase [Candidatus Zixiibacteriota bacterium]